MKHRRHAMNHAGCEVTMDDDAFTLRLPTRLRNRAVDLIRGGIFKADPALAARPGESHADVLRLATSVGLDVLEARLATPGPKEVS